MLKSFVLSSISGISLADIYFAKTFQVNAISAGFKGVQTGYSLDLTFTATEQY